MGDPTTIALNLTFFGTLGVALIMFFGLFLVFVATLVIAGLGRLTAVTIMAAGRGLFRAVGRTNNPANSEPRDRPVRAAKTARADKPARPVKPVRIKKLPRASKPAQSPATVKPEPALSPGWAAAVEKADARAVARAKAAAPPEVKVSVRDLPSPTAPTSDLAAVAPLVESATDRNGQLGSVPPAFKKTLMPAAKSLLDTGSLVSLPGRLPLPRLPLNNHSSEQPQQNQAHERKAG